MKGFCRQDQLFSLCGLHCGLCPMKVGGHCPGCGGGEGNQPCRLARCAISRGGLDYCFQCGEYPCEKYQGFDQYDSFITHQRRQADIQAAQADLQGCRQQLRERADILAYLLENCNDGRRRSFFCLGASLLDLEELRLVIARLQAQRDLPDQKARASQAVQELRAAAERQGVTLALRKRPKKEKRDKEV